MKFHINTQIGYLYRNRSTSFGWAPLTVRHDCHWYMFLEGLKGNMPPYMSSLLNTESLFNML